MMHDHASMRRHAQHQHGERIKGILREHGGRTDEASDRAMVKRAMGEHDAQLHPGKHTKLKLKDGGHIEGHPSRRRLDRGGRARGKGSHVNVIVAPGQGQARPVPVPVPAAGGPPRPPMAPPMAGPPMAGGPGMMPPGGMPPGMMPPGLARPPLAPGAMPPPGMIRRSGGRVGRKDGGRTNDAGEAHAKGLAAGPDMTAGAHSGLGRLQKMRSKVKSAAAAGD